MGCIVPILAVALLVLVIFPLVPVVFSAMLSVEKMMPFYYIYKMKMVRILNPIAITPLYPCVLSMVVME